MQKRQINIRLTENGIIKLQELRNHFGFTQSALVELLITLYHEKILVRKEVPPDDAKESK